MCVCVCLCVCKCVKHCLCATYVSVFLPAVTQPETIIFSVELHRNGQNLGITLTGAYLHVHWHPMLLQWWSVDCTFNFAGSGHHPGHPIIISNIKEGGVAYK